MGNAEQELVCLAADAHDDLSARNTRTEGETPYECIRHPLGALGLIRQVPGFLAQGLLNLPGAPEYVVQVDPSAAPFVT